MGEQRPADVKDDPFAFSYTQEKKCVPAAARRYALSVLAWSRTAPEPEDIDEEEEAALSEEESDPGDVVEQSIR